MTPKVHSFPLLENIDKVDKLTLLFAFSLIFTGIIGLLTQSPTHHSDGLGDKIAYVEVIQNTARRKSISSLIWGDAQDQMELFYGDEMMTSDNSSMTIIFLDETILEIPENSLVRLTRTDDFIDINLLRGSFKISAPKEKQQKIEKSFRLIKVSGETEPLVSNQTYTQRPTPVQNQVVQSELKNTGTGESITTQQTYQVDYQIPETYQQQFVVADSLQTAQLMATTQTNPDMLEFAIYKDNKIHQVLAYSSEGVQAQLPRPGHYFWEIRNKNTPPSQKMPDFDKMAKITVKKPLLNQSEKIKQSMTTHEAQNFVLPLTYDLSPKESEPVLIEVFKKDNLSTPILSEVKQLGARPLAIKIDAGPGDYQWRVTPQNTQSLLAPTESIGLKINEIPAKPIAPLLPEKLVLNYVKISGVDSYRIELPRQKNATKYYLEVFEDAELNKRVYRQLQDGHVFTWRTTRSGHYYYRYQYTDQWGRQSPLSLRGDLFFPISPFVDF